MKQGWKTCKFADVFDLQMGKTPSRDNPTYWGDDNMWVSIADMNEQKYMSATKEGITDVAVQESGIKPIPKGTVIMSFKLSIGKVSIATSKLYTNEAIMGFIEKEEGTLVPEYLYYYLKGYKWEGANKAAMGMTLNKKTIAENTISYPPVAEQAKIVEELDCLSGIIEKKKQQLKELDNLTQSIFYEMFGDPVENDKGWEVKKLGDIAYIGLGFTHTPEYVDNGVPFLSVKDISSGTICWDNIKYVSQQEYDSAPKGARPNKGDIMFCRVGTMGKPVIIDTDTPFCTFVSLGYLHLLDDNILNVYVKHWMQSYAFDVQVEANVKGVAIKNLNTGWLKTFVIQIPPSVLQKEYALKIEAIEKQKEQIAQSIKETETLFNSRMDYYFN